ncbi:hypothetical protein QDQ39_02360 [Providencia rettgeri]|uniref:hypothetical protein n=1 Tax=Providencia TaxID=586 RepID=UPI00029BC175|nr:MULTISPECIES: hypothetical protein [Providencia]EKT66896.1 hypothetical protein OO9_03553 [Providencia alcalifaciens Dmel2]EUD07571.1 hypothetical protein HMPREF1564_1206 [Providencia alcalifaciens R90-1475]MDH2394646.1 hypothetical protein [Providencia rettgeri]
MSEINELKAEIEKMKSELVANKILISALLIHVAGSDNLPDLMFKIPKLTKALGVNEDDEEVQTHLGFYIKKLLERGKYK